MPAIEPLCKLIGIKPELLTKEENLILEVVIFNYICAEIKESQRQKNHQYFRLLKLTKEMENHMLETNFLRFIINDIIATGEYNLQGIACYTNTHEDVLTEIVSGYNKNPSANFLCQILDLHRSVRKEFYNNIVKKIILNHTDHVCC